MTDPNCLFCKIVRREIPADEVLRDEHVVAFHDRNPQAPTHVLVVPTEHAAHLSDYTGSAAGAADTRITGPDSQERGLTCALKEATKLSTSTPLRQHKHRTGFARNG